MTTHRRSLSAAPAAGSVAWQGAVRPWAAVARRAVGHAGAVHLREVPMPAAVASRPRDARGIPVPAITRWERGEPVFREASGERQLLCALQNRCSICATQVDQSEGVWQVVDEQAAKWISYALRRGAEPASVFTTYEVPGHYACMLYAAVACPFLANSNARRTIDGELPGLEDDVSAGTRRGALSALVEFATCMVRILPERDGYEVVLAQPRTIHTYRDGTELLPLLQAAVDAQQTDVEPSQTTPMRTQRHAGLFGPDERAVVRELRRSLKATSH